MGSRTDSSSSRKQGTTAAQNRRYAERMNESAGRNRKQPDSVRTGRKRKRSDQLNKLQ